MAFTAHRLNSKQYQRAREKELNHLVQTPAVIVEPAYGDFNFDYNLSIGAETCVSSVLVNAEHMQTGGFSSDTSGADVIIDTKEAQINDGKAELRSGQANVINDDETMVIHDDDTMVKVDDEIVVFHDGETVVIPNDEDSLSNEVYDNSNVANYADARENYLHNEYSNFNDANSDHNYYGNIQHLAFSNSNDEPNGLEESLESGDNNIEDTQTEDYWDGNEEPNYAQTSVENEHNYNGDPQFDIELQSNDELNRHERDRELREYIEVEDVDDESSPFANVTVVEVHRQFFEVASDDDLEGNYDRNYARRNNEYRHNYNEVTHSDDELEGDHESNRIRENLHSYINDYDSLRFYSRYEEATRAQSDVEYPGKYGHINCQCKKCVQCGKPIIRFQSDLIRATWRLNEKLKELKKYEHTANILQRALDLPYDANRDKLVVKILNILNARMRTLEKARVYGKRKARMQKYCTECEIYQDDYYYRRSRYRN